MSTISHFLEVGSARLKQLLDDAAGAPCLIRFPQLPANGEQLATFGEVGRGRICLRMQAPLGAIGSRAVVTVGGLGLQFESAVLSGATDSALVLDTPLWAVRCDGEPHDVLALNCQLRYCVEGHIHWRTGSALDIVGHTIRFTCRTEVPVNARLALRLNPNGHPTSVFGTGRVTKSAPSMDGAMICIEMQEWSFPAEMILKASYAGMYGGVARVE